MAKKKVPDLYPDLPTTLPEVEALIHQKLAHRDALRVEAIRISTESTNVEREIKHLERQARFILGTETPSEIELEQEKIRREAREGTGRFKPGKPQKEPDPALTVPIKTKKK